MINLKKKITENLLNILIIKFVIKNKCLTFILLQSFLTPVSINKLILHCLINKVNFENILVIVIHS